MKLRLCLVLLTALAFTACPTTGSKKKDKKAAATAALHNELNADMDFQAFIGRLRKATKARDMNMVASMMTQDFAYVLGATPAEDRQGPGVFQYWDENGLWLELEGILSEKFVQKDDFMVAPPQFADPAAEYVGYRAGIRRVNGSWKFVYFVTNSSGPSVVPATPQ